MTDPIAWTVAQVFRTANLPCATLPTTAYRRPKNAAISIRACLDSVWRSRNEIAQLTGTHNSTVTRTLAEMVEEGTAEKLSGSRWRADQFRRSQEQR